MNSGTSYFAENNEDWQSIPDWVHFLIRFGYHWGRSEHQGRRIALLSMPCASPGAGLIALGAMISDLGSNEADEINSHNDALFECARQYLDHCRGCELLKCDPMLKKCGYDKKATGIIRSIRRANHLYLISDQTDYRSKKLVLMDSNGGNAREINPEYIFNLYVDGQPPKVSPSAETGLQESAYQGLIKEAQIYPANLRKSYSGLVLAGRAKGGSDTRAAYESIHFCNDTESYTLAELLAIHEWTDSKVSRTVFFNVRTEIIDHAGAQPKLVVADGDLSFLKSVDTFKKNDVIGVIDRSLDRDRLEIIGQKIAALKGWYQPDSEFQQLLPTPVPGITVAILKKQ